LLCLIVQRNSFKCLFYGKRRYENPKRKNFQRDSWGQAPPEKEEGEKSASKGGGEGIEKGA
jgi:hypothetical protein